MSCFSLVPLRSRDKGGRQSHKSLFSKHLCEKKGRELEEAVVSAGTTSSEGEGRGGWVQAFQAVQGRFVTASEELPFTGVSCLPGTSLPFSAEGWEHDLGLNAFCFLNT